MMPIAVRGNSSNVAHLDVFQASIAPGNGADLPAILGANTMQDRDAVIILRRGKEQLVLPGPQGYRITWSPGTKTFPMKKHLQVT